MLLLTLLVSYSHTKGPVFVEPKLYPLKEKFFQTVLQFAYIFISLLFLFTNSACYTFKLCILLNSRSFCDFHLCIHSQNISPRFYMGIFLLLLGGPYCFNTYCIVLVYHFISCSVFSSVVNVFLGEWLFLLFTCPCTKLTVCIDILEIMMC